MIRYNRLKNSISRDETRTVWLDPRDQKMHPYLEGYQFVAVTDHPALKYLRNLKEPTNRPARWALELQKWDFEIIHRKGKQFELLDAISRMFEDGDERVVGFTEVEDKSYLV